MLTVAMLALLSSIGYFEISTVSSSKKEIEIYCSHGIRTKAILDVSASSPWVLGLHWKEEKFCFEGADLFNCLVQLRELLAAQDCKPLCNGARIDVFPSAMSREMSGGRVAYITRMCVSTSREDIVDIFDSADEINVGSVDEQKAIHADWGNH